MLRELYWHFVCSCVICFFIFFVSFFWVCWRWGVVCLFLTTHLEKAKEGGKKPNNYALSPLKNPAIPSPPWFALITVHTFLGSRTKTAHSTCFRHNAQHFDGDEFSEVEMVMLGTIL